MDNAATTQKPRSVIHAISKYYETENANIHRGAYALSRRSTELYENSRRIVKEFIGAKDDCEIIFTKNTTESINIVARAFCDAFLKSGGNIITTELEHHSNYLPWLAACRRKSAEFRVLPVTEDGLLDISPLERMIDKGTALVAVTGASNGSGVLTPLDTLIKIAHAHGVPVLVDGAQLAPHADMDVYDLDCDFFVFSSHKVYGPNGMGVLYGKKMWLDKMLPDAYGGDMVNRVGKDFDSSSWQPLPAKFEAGTQDVGGAVGFAAALQYIREHGASRLHEYERSLTDYALKRLNRIEGINVIAKNSPRVPLISFVSSAVSPYDLSMLLSARGIASRCGEMCAQPLMKKLGLVSGLARISIAFYNTEEEIARFCDVIEEIQARYI
ncbi:cysteine desulfurase [Treponema parvum]|uniref:cysteine desulfurase n=1 Tax=Treponema parvum TaxID=138851 RepID=A0A975F2V0_9SPIR|nr:cysteine desulfurase [Treponema parvum]QTQ13368.1 cysteine desulfurase [Treponema parvum]